MAPLQKLDAPSITEYDMASSMATLASVKTNTDAFPSKPLHKKSVRFAEVTKNYLIPNLDSYEQWELDSAFLTDEDYERLSRENEITLTYMNRGIYPEDEQLFFRGLEGGMMYTYFQKKKLVDEAVSAILQRQAENNNLLEPAWLNSYHARFTYPSMVNAFRIGTWDAQLQER
jgi:hypothetical protein